MEYTLKDFINNLINNHQGQMNEPLGNEKVMRDINAALPQKYIVVESKTVLHYFINDGPDNFCKQCGLYMTDRIHKRG